MRTFPTEIAAISFLREMRWKSGVVCQRCGAVNHSYVHQTKENGCRKYRCKTCRHIFSDTSNTIFHRSKISLQLWFFAIHEFFQNRYITSVELGKRLGIRQQKAWKILAILKKNSTEIKSLFAQEEQSCLDNKSASAGDISSVFVTTPNEQNIILGKTASSETRKHERADFLSRDRQIRDSSRPKNPTKNSFYYPDL